MISEYMSTAPQPFVCHKRKGEKIAKGNKSMTEESNFHYSHGISFREYSDDHKQKRDTESLSNSKCWHRAKRSEGKVMTTEHLLIFSMSSKTTKGPGVLDDGQY